MGMAIRGLWDGQINFIVPLFIPEYLSITDTLPKLQYPQAVRSITPTMWHFSNRQEFESSRNPAMLELVVRLGFMGPDEWWLDIR